MASTLSTPVLIVGAGPSGLVLALTLLKNGVPVRVIEKEERARVGQRGAGIMPRSQELYSALGVWTDMQQIAQAVPPMCIYKLPGGLDTLITFQVDPPIEPAPSTPHTNAVMLGQGHAEAILRSHLAKYGCQVELGTELCGFEQRQDQVLAHVVKRDGDNETADVIVSRWLIGADGARGIVRKQLGLSFNGNTRDLSEHLVIGDIEVRGLNRKHWHSWGDMETIFVTLRPTEDEGIYALFLGGHVDFPKVVADREELAKALRAGTGRDDLEVGAIKWLSEYKPHERMVDKFSEGRVFVAGDAAHVHSPFGAQGMNSSVQDAVNLGWKLALVEKGLAAPSLLDTYNEERLPVIAEMIQTSKTLFNQTLEAKKDGSTSEKAWFRGGHLNQLGVNYRWSSIVVNDRSPRELRPMDPYGILRSASDIVRAGERAPDAPGLVEVAGNNNAGQSKTAALFDIFGPAHHTVLLFSDDIDQILPVIHDMRQYSADTIRSAIVLAPARDEPVELLQYKMEWADHVLLDQGGHAYTGYSVSLYKFTIVIVRPDGIVGGILYDSNGVKRYFDGIFSASTSVTAVQQK